MRPEQPPRDEPLPDDVRPGISPGRVSCEQARELMVEAIALGPDSLPAALEAHVGTCPSCRREWEELVGELQALRSAGAGEPLPEVSVGLFQATLRRLDEPRESAGMQTAPADRQMPSECSRPDRRPVPAGDPGLPAWWVRVLQHMYLAVLGIGLWVALASGQTAFLEAMSSFGFELSGWVLVDYGLFVTWFIAGGLSALVALPLLLQDAWNREMLPPGGSAANPETPLTWMGRWLRKGQAGRIRGVVWVW